jgi:hypothetical protein
MSASDDEDARAKPGAGRAGGVAHDSRGNAIWQWAVDTGRHAFDSTSRLLRRLEVPGLKVQDDARADPAPEDAQHHPAAKTPGRPPGAAPGAAVPPRSSGYDPYGGSGSAPPPRTPRKPAAAAAPRRSLWRRLFRLD